MGSLGGSPALQLASSSAVALALPLSAPWKQGEDSPPPWPPELWDERRGAVNVHKELLGFCWKRS